ncbi:hypothetical protein BDC45DRAFT_540339 [Circinella umbellata]|nr:hypothetical protein BDC45DRAFT_540339 [Circinella umbellata]
MFVRTSLLKSNLDVVMSIQRNWTKSMSKCRRKCSFAKFSRGESRLGWFLTLATGIMSTLFDESFDCYFEEVFLFLRFRASESIHCIQIVHSCSSFSHSGYMFLHLNVFKGVYITVSVNGTEALWEV